MVRNLIGSLLFLAAFAVSAVAADLERYRIYVDGPWGQIHLRVEGSASDPTVVMVHQMTWSSDQYKFAQRELAARGVRSIAMDIPGYGESDGPPGAPSSAQYAEAILPVLDYFKLNRAVLLGTNTGATFISVLADRHPERVKHLILEGVPIWDADTREKLANAPHADQRPQEDGSHLSKRWDGSMKMSHGRLSLAATQENILKSFAAGPREWYAHDAVFRTDLEPIIKRLKSSATVITYSGQELYETSKSVPKIRPDFKVIELSVGDSMAPAFDNPKEWAEAVAAIVKARD